jgi:hypothetical protein
VDIAFDRLIRLQDVDTEISRLSSLLGEIPARLEAIDARIQSTNAVVAQAREKLGANQKKRRDLEGEVKSIRESIAKYKRQLNDVKSNKEYDAINKEITETQARIDGIEEAILNEMISADDVERDIKAAQKTQHDEEGLLKKEKESIAAERAELEKHKAVVEAERAALVPQIPADQLRLYERISRKMNGLAMSKVTDDFCSICQMRVRPQLLDEIMGMKHVITCEACGRILYWPKPAVEDIPEEKADDPNKIDDSASR